MAIFSSLFKTKLFIEFDEKLKYFLELDKELSNLVEEIEGESKIHKGIFIFGKRVIDVNKVDKNKMQKLFALFQNLENIEYSLLRDLQKNKAVLLELDKKLTQFIERELATIFKHIKEARVIIAEIVEYLQEFKAEELKDDFGKLDKELHKIRRFIDMLIYYCQFGIKEVKEKPFFRC